MILNGFPPNPAGIYKISAISECHRMVLVILEERSLAQERLPESKGWLGRWAHRQCPCLFSTEANPFAHNVFRDHRAVSHCRPNAIHLRDMDGIENPDIQGRSSHVPSAKGDDDVRR